jgi:hypothetical protein
MKTNIHFLSYLAQFLWNVSDESCRENQNTQSVLIIRVFAIYELMWKNIIEQNRLQISIWHMRIAR